MTTGRIPKRFTASRGWGEIAPPGADSALLMDRWRLMRALARHNGRVLFTLHDDVLPLLPTTANPPLSLAVLQDEIEDERFAVEDGHLHEADAQWQSFHAGLMDWAASWWPEGWPEWLIDTACATLGTWARVPSAAERRNWHMAPVAYFQPSALAPSPQQGQPDVFDPFTESATEYRNRTSRYSAAVESQIDAKRAVAASLGLAPNPTERVPFVPIDPNDPERALVEWRARDPFAWFTAFVLDDESAAQIARRCGKSRRPVEEAIVDIGGRVGWPVSPRKNQHPR